MTRIKICGITCIEDALAAAEMGADALGFNFAAGPRKISPDKAAEIISRLPPFISIVGIFIGEDDKIVRICNHCGIQIVQLHGDYSERFSKKLHPRPVIRVIHVKSIESLQELQKDKAASAFLLDASVPGKLGGTGVTFDWDIAVEAKNLGRPIILAGGLKPDNVSEAILKVRPYAVDVSSGIESSPGKKDHKLLKEFIENVRTSDGSS